MKTTVLITLAILATCGPPRAEVAEDMPITKDVEKGIGSGTERFDHSSFDGFMRAGVKEGYFDYVSGQAQEVKLRKYLDAVASTQLSSISRNDLLALLINAYNGYTIQLILTRYPDLKSIKEFPSPWDAPRYVIGGHKISLNNIEHNLLRPLFKDPRIHAAVNCASIGCGPLPPGAFDGDHIDQQLDDQMRVWLAAPRVTRVADDRLALSRVFDWYGDDFTAESRQGSEKTIVRFVAKYAPEKIKSFVESHGGNPPVDFIPYDWSLNDASRMK